MREQVNSANAEPVANSVMESCNYALRPPWMQPRDWGRRLGQGLQRLVLQGLGAACWGCELPLPVGELGPWCPGCQVAVERGLGQQRLDDLPLESLWTYAGAVAVALGRAKSRGQALPLAVIEADWRGLAQRTLRRAGADAVCAMPPQQQRLAQRGWSLPDQLALICGCEVQWPLVRLDQQAPRRLDRQESPKFACVPAPAHPPRLVIVDDVVTTGASLRAARQALTQAGWPVSGTLVLADAQPQAIAWVLGGAAEEQAEV